MTLAKAVFYFGYESYFKWMVHHLHGVVAASWNGESPGLCWPFPATKNTNWTAHRLLFPKNFTQV